MTGNMTCNEAAEFVSALCDGETISPEAAKHIGACDGCQARLRDYVAMGVELRRVASLEPAYDAPALQWRERPVWWKQLWWKGWEMMRVPRLAFAALVLVTFLAIGSVWTKDWVGAQSEGSVVLLKIEHEGSSEPMNCALSLVDANRNSCAFMDMAPMSSQMVGVLFEAEGRVDGGVKILAKSASSGAVPMPGMPGKGFRSSLYIDDLKKSPGRELILIPGKPLSVDIAGMPKMTLHGEWSDHIPPFFALQHKSIDPGAGELRISSPLLLKGKMRIGDMDGGSATASRIAEGVEITYPRAGRYIFALSPMKDAVEGKINQGRITFIYQNQQYTLLTGAPIARSEQVWVRAEPDYVSPDGPDSGSIGTYPIGEFAMDK